VIRLSLSVFSQPLMPVRLRPPKNDSELRPLKKTNPGTVRGGIRLTGRYRNA
jgi:hypothetical protein